MNLTDKAIDEKFEVISHLTLLFIIDGVEFDVFFWLPLVHFPLYHFLTITWNSKFLSLRGDWPELLPFVSCLKFKLFFEFYMALFQLFSFQCNLHSVKCVQIRSFFGSVFSHIRTEYGEILCISPYSVRMRENTDQEKLRIWTLFTQCSFGYSWLTHLKQSLSNRVSPYIKFSCDKLKWGKVFKNGQVRFVEDRL